MDDRDYTSFEAARILGIDESNIRRRCLAGKLPGAYRGVLRTREIWMIPAAALDLPARGKGAGDGNTVGGDTGAGTQPTSE